ncbi:PiggyBac transposable element-derived protein 4 [Eumeta japonica]|uniref:PiggyBac transposable element-derived protein 4 n=1 Tax=Eumeta variegata TaxID=151549 RepID=A0A4C1UB63_EUMVA|nr:PiggyBac transposable element-derived protein 4 [Eumeta japonica]
MKNGAVEGVSYDTKADIQKSNCEVCYNESICNCEDDEEEAENQPNPMVLGDLIRVQIAYDDIYDYDDDLPLSSWLQQNPDSTESNNGSSNMSLMIATKWEKNYRMDMPDEFSERVGLSDQILSMENVIPLLLFRLFWTEHLQDILCFQNNLYPTQTGKPFTPITTEELNVFIALNLVMGIKKLPSYRDYWSSAPDLHDSYVSKFMSFNRFSCLLNNLHVNDNSVVTNRTDPKYDKLYKIRPLLDILQNNFQKNYKPSERVAIDESMIKFKGRNSLKQYMPKKPTKRGY